jgi:hypothetical protein
MILITAGQLATAGRHATAETRGVADTGDKFATAVFDTGGKFANYLLILVVDHLTISIFATYINDTSDRLCR